MYYSINLEQNQLSQPRIKRKILKMGENYILLKFIKSEYVDSFLDGNIYMNTLHYFWNEYNIQKNMPEYQKDVLEGSIYECKIDFEPFRGNILTNALLRSSGYQYCNIACFYKLKYNLDGLNICYAIPNNMKAFGDAVVIIDDVKGLIRRINFVTESLGYKFLCGDITYKNPQLNVQHSQILEKRLLLVESDETYFGDIESIWDCFVKSIKYSQQNEWRIALYRGVKDTNAYTLKLGNLRSIAHAVSANELVQELDKMFMKCKIFPGIVGYQGNINRKEMAKLFHRLGGYKAQMFFTLG